MTQFIATLGSTILGMFVCAVFICSADFYMFTHVSYDYICDARKDRDSETGNGIEVQDRTEACINVQV